MQSRQREAQAIFTRSYGSINSGVVCGDRFCNESSIVAYTKKVIHVDMPEFMPTIQNIQTNSFSGDLENTYPSKLLAKQLG